MKTQKRNIKFLERKEVEQIINAIEIKTVYDARDKALIEVLFSTGMRIHEALALQMNEMLILLEEKGTSEFPIIGKGGWQRVIFFSPKAKKSVRVFLEHEDAEQSELLFDISIRRAQVIVARRGKLAGITKKVSPHVFRHSLATDLLRRGVDIRFVSEFLGHRSINNTMIYTHVVNEQLRSIHKKIYK